MRIKLWLLLGLYAGATASGCAKGASGTDLDADLSPATGSDGGGGEEDAGPEPEAGSDETDAGDPDASAPEAGNDASRDAGGGASDAAMDGSDAGAGGDASSDGSGPDAGSPDAGSPDAGSLDAGSPDTGTPDAGPVAAPLPTGPKYGEWTWVQVDGSSCRDGSPAGYYHRRGNDNLMIFLNGSGACMDPFFCGFTPRNVNESLNKETLGATSVNLFIGPDQVRQTPPEEGILKRDNRNPVGGWSMIFVPYCTGDVHAGSKPDGMVPGVSGTQKFVGYTNLGLFLKSFGPSFVDTKRVLLVGTGAGGFGALLNLERVQTFFDPQGAKVTIITDSGIPFQDAYLEPCLQKRWRDLWNLNAIMPPNCSGCLNANGGGLAKGLGTYLFQQKYKGVMSGGVVSSDEDEIVKVFFSAGLQNCTVDTGLEAVAQTFGGGSYMTGRFPKGISDAITNVVGADSVAYYLISAGQGSSSGRNHMHIWRSRYYEENGLGQTMASWVADILKGSATHRGTLAPLP